MDVAVEQLEVDVHVVQAAARHYMFQPQGEQRRRAGSAVIGLRIVLSGVLLPSIFKGRGRSWVLPPSSSITRDPQRVALRYNLSS